MIIRKYSVLIICLSFYQLLPAQDGKLSWYYPTLGDVNPGSGKKGVYNTHGVSGCVSGNCKSGYGEYLVAATTLNPIFDIRETIDSDVILTLYKGQFSNDGKDFEGTVYTREVYYEVEYKKNAARLVPKIKENLVDEAFWKPYEVATGKMTHDGKNYKWNGWMELPLPAGAAVTPGQPVSTKAHFIPDAGYIKIKYAPGSTHTEVEGRTLPNGDLLCGRLRYPDSSMYEGFLHNGARFGPGRYTLKNGKTEEGIWMLDSLAFATPVSFSKEIFEPVAETIPPIGNMSFGGYSWTKPKDAGNGWVYAFYRHDVFIGKAEGGNLNGPGFWFTESGTPNSDVGRVWHTYRTGIFKNGFLVSGMRVRDVIESKTTYKDGLKYDEFSRSHTTVMSGEFDGEQLKPSCAKLTRYNDKGNRVYQVEGYFSPGHFKTETAEGWAYVNDWEGKREPANLQFMHNNENYLLMEGAPGYVTWFTRGFETSQKEIYCFPQMKAQSALILPLMKYRHDSVVAVANKRNEEILARKAEWEKRESLCQSEGAKYNYKVGDLYQVGEDARFVRILINGTYTCGTKSFPVIVQSWFQSTPNTGYLRTSTTNMTVEKLKEAKKMATSLVLCEKCTGRGTMPATVYTDVGGNSGYTAIGGGWAVKNPETYWKSETMVQCKHCAGIGFTRK